MRFARVLRDLSGFLEGQGLGYALIGGHALAALGLARTTLDLDLVVESRGQEELRAYLEAEGYATLHRSAGYSNHLHSNPERGRIDCVYVGGETAAQLFAGVRHMTGPGGETVPVPRPEHLAAMKAMPGQSAVSVPAAGKGVERPVQVGQQVEPKDLLVVTK